MSRSQRFSRTLSVSTVVCGPIASAGAGGRFRLGAEHGHGREVGRDGPLRRGGGEVKTLSERFRIDSLCQLAVPTFLSIRNVCVTPNATLLFHSGGVTRTRPHEREPDLAYARRL